MPKAFITDIDGTLTDDRRRLSMHAVEEIRRLVDAGIPISEMSAAGLFDKLIKVKYEIPNDKPEMFGDYNRELDEICENLLAKHRRVEDSQNEEEGK